MLTNPMDILTMFPVRKSRKQKQAFRDAVQSYLRDLGYEAKIEKGSFGCQNVVIGDPENAKYLITAHYDTPAGIPFPNLITPCNVVTFLLYQMFILVIMFGFMALVGLVVVAMTDDSQIAFQAAYASLWIFLGLMMFGPANKNNANDNTSGVVTVLETLRTMPDNQRSKVCFVLFDLEEAGLVGSAAYRKAHKKASENQIVLNLDCVGDGDEIVFFPTKKLRKDHHIMAHLCRCVGHYGPKSIAVRAKGFSYYPSDQGNFPYGVGIAALHRSKWAGLYLGRIHTKQDTILEETNVNILRAALTTLISSDAAQ